jgi:hypothetical protein
MSREPTTIPVQPAGARSLSLEVGARAEEVHTDSDRRIVAENAKILGAQTAEFE